MMPKLGELNLTLRWLMTVVLLVLAAGYGAAIMNMHYTYSMMDGRAGVTAEDLKRAFHGRRTVTRLAAKIDGGSMEQFLPNALDKARILNWLQDGAPRESFKKDILPCLERELLALPQSRRR